MGNNNIDAYTYATEKIYFDTGELPKHASFIRYIIRVCACKGIIIANHPLDVIRLKL